MGGLTERLTAWPTVGFTALLMLCGAWWLLSVLLGSADGDVDTGDHHGHVHTPHRVGARGSRPATQSTRATTGPRGPRGRGRRGRVRRQRRGSGRGRLARALGLDVLPLSFALSLFALGAWTVSLLGQTALAAPLSPVAAVALCAGAIAVGVVFVHRCSRLLEPLFITTTAPERAATNGALCRVRVLHPSVRTGDVRGTADVLSGPNRGATVQIHADADDPELPVKGGLAVLVTYDDELASFLVVAAPPGAEEL